MTDQQAAKPRSKAISMGGDFQKPFLHRAYFNHRFKNDRSGRFCCIHITVKSILNNISNLDLNNTDRDSLEHEECCHYHLHIKNKGYKHRDHDIGKQPAERSGWIQTEKDIAKRLTERRRQETIKYRYQ